MSFRFRIAKGVTIGKTGLRVTEKIGPVHISTGRSGTFLRATEGPVTYRKTLSRGTRSRRPVSGRRVPSPVAERRYYLGMRRAWWVLLCIAAIIIVELLPVVGPFLGVAVLVWMIIGLVLARPRAVH